jgi:hypothetical protein
MIQTAKKMDMYSFGMVCLWVLFRDQMVKFLKNGVLTRGMARTSQCSSCQTRHHSPDWNLFRQATNSPLSLKL